MVASDEEDENISDWLLRDLLAITADMEDGRYLRDLKEIGTALCEVNQESTLVLMERPRGGEKVQNELELVLPYYLPLLKDDLAAHGEETHLSTAQCSELLAKHNRPTGPTAAPKLMLESGNYGYALLQAAAMLANIDDSLVGLWYLQLKEDLHHAQRSGL